jgi:threonine dehydrogenase-like Zn-dependent dehydrogenase
VTELSASPRSSPRSNWALSASSPCPATPSDKRWLTTGYGAHGVVEAVGLQESMSQAIRSTRPGGHVGYVGIPFGGIDAFELLSSGAQLAGGVAPVRRFLPELLSLVWGRTINPGKVFDLTIPLDQAADGYQAMDERRAIKVLLTP